MNGGALQTAAASKSASSSSSKSESSLFDASHMVAGGHQEVVGLNIGANGLQMGSSCSADHGIIGSGRNVETKAQAMANSKSVGSCTDAKAAAASSAHVSRRRRNAIASASKLFRPIE